MASPNEAGGANSLRIPLLDVAILLYHVHRGAAIEDVGFEDCDRTLRQLTSALSPKYIAINKEALESALWSSNLMDEIGEFDHPAGLSFEDFVRQLLNNGGRPGERLEFDRIYNQIRSRKNNP